MDEKSERKSSVVILGGGPVAASAAIGFARDGWSVQVFEMRADPRTSAAQAGRSINLSLSTRGLTALDALGVGDAARALGVRMYSRLLHGPSAPVRLTEQRYGWLPTHFNYSVSRRLLTDLLITEAEARGARFFFNRKAMNVDPLTGEVVVAGPDDEITVTADLVVGADGAWSATRRTLMARRDGRFDFWREFCHSSYKELEIPALPGGGFALRSDVLHIWPRITHMLIALPNTNGTFTATLFLDDARLQDLERRGDDDILAFFAAEFPDVPALVPDLASQVRHNPLGSLTTVRVDPIAMGRVALVGDASHGVVPFYGQGLNSGFEDVRVLLETLAQARARGRGGDGRAIEDALSRYSRGRKADLAAICDLSLHNYVEMRRGVVTWAYRARLWLDRALCRFVTARWAPLYTMVTYSNLPYAEVMKKYHRQNAIINGIVKASVWVVALNAAFAMGYLASRAPLLAWKSK